MSEKEQFIESMKKRSKMFAVDVIAFSNVLKKNKASEVITYQLIRSATSVGANYRAACKARSKKEFFSKISIVAEEIDESEYWLELIKDSNMTDEDNNMNKLLSEANEINKIVSKARSTIYYSGNPKN